MPVMAEEPAPRQDDVPAGEPLPDLDESDPPVRLVMVKRLQEIGDGAAAELPRLQLSVSGS